MNNTLWRSTILFVLFLTLSTYVFAGDTPCGATPIPNNMTSFQTFSNQGNANSGIADPGCGNYVTADFWFSVTVPFSGMLNIATLAGGMTNGAMAIYDGPCGNPNLLSCTEDDNCGNTIMPIMNLTGLNPGNTLYIRIWAEFGAPNGTFEIRVSDGPIGPIPLPTTSTVGTAQYTEEDCVQLTTTAPGQSGCAWDPNQIDLTQPFDETFNFNFGSNDAGADGICWVFQNNPSGLNTCGNTGQNIAADFTNSFIVEFDTYDNGPGFGDIPTDHVSVNVNGAMGAPINGPYNLGNIEDGLDHEIRLVWNPATNGYEIYFDGALALSGNYDIINNCLGGNPNCYWGFTASTGGAVNNQSVCPIDVPEFPAGTLTTVDVEICEGESYYAGGANQTQSGFYTDTNPLPNGCNEVINTNLTVNPASTYFYDAVLCQGECEFIGNQSFCFTGNYEVNLNNQASNGCDSIVTLNLTILDPFAIAFPPPPLTCFNTTTVIDASPSTSGPGMVTYSWTGPSPGCIVSGENTTTPVVNCPGTYTMALVQVLNGTVCSALVSVDVIDAIVFPTVEAGDNQSFDCNTNCVTLSSAGSDTGPNIVLTWTGPNNFMSNDPFPEVCEAGIYTLTLFNQANGCIATDIVFVSGNANPPDASASVSGLLTCNNLEVTLDGSTSSGIGNLDFEWFDQNSNSIGSTAQVDVTQMGTYTLVITDDANGCTAETIVFVGENTNEPIAIAIAPDSLDCTSNSVTVDGSFSSGVGTLSYEWQNLNGDSLGEGVTTQIASPGIYVLIITDGDNGCTSSTSVQVFQNIDPPTALASVSGDLTCNDILVTLDGTNSSGNGTISFEWLNPASNVIATTGMIDIDIAGTYTLIITDAENGCTASTTIDVGENIEAPNPVAEVNEVLTCINNDVTLNGSNSSGIGIISYEWFDTNGNSLGTDSTLSVSNTATYILVITDDDNGCTAETTINAMEDMEAPEPDIVADGIFTCVDLEVQLDGSGSSGSGTIDYEWFDASGNSLGTGSTVDVLDSDTYTLIITDDANGCTAETTIDIAEDVVAPNADAGDNTFITCQNSETTLDGSNSSTGIDYTYEWVNGGGVTVGTAITVDVSETGIYTLIVTDETNGCTSSSTTEVEPDANLPIADAGIGGTITCATTSVSLDGSGSSNGPNISYEWLDPNGGSLGSNLAIDATIIGTYILVVTDDDNGCSATSSVEVDEDTNLPNFDISNIPTLTCSETEIIVSAINPNGENLNFEWENSNGDNIGTGIDVAISEAGEYSLIVTNLDNGCTDLATFEAFSDTLAPVADAGLDGLLTCANTVYTLDGSNSSNGAESYEWIDPNGDAVGTGMTLDVSNIGIYTLIVTNDTNGCTASAEVEVTEDVQAPQAEAGVDLILNCNISMVLLDGSNSSGGNLSYEWQDANGTIIENAVTTEVTDTGAYVLVITNTDNGCTANDIVEVNGDFETPNVDPGIADLLTCVDTLVTLDGSNSTGTGMLEFEWLDSNNNSLSTVAVVVINDPGVYTLVVTNTNNGCTETSAIIVDENITPPVSNAGQGASLTCDEIEVTLTGSGTSQSGNTSFEWQNAGGIIVGTTPAVQVSEIGIYTLIVTDEDNGCTASSTVEVTPDANLPTAIAGPSFTLTCSETEVTLDGTNSSSGPNISYEWQDANGTFLGDTNTQLTNTPGQYTLIVTDTDNGCSATSTVEIFENVDPPTANAGLDATLTCDDSEIIVDGGMSTVNSGVITNYDWYDENGLLISTFAFADVSEPGIYTLVVTGSNGCTDSDEIEIVVDASVPEAIIGAGGLLTCDTISILLGDVNSNSGLNVSYQWTNSIGDIIDSVATIQVSNPDTYTLLVTNLDNNCETTAALQILQDLTPPDADAGIPATLTCLLTEYELGGMGTSTGIDFSYEWQDVNNQVIDDQITTTISIPGDYTLVVTNEANGCTNQSNIFIDQNIETPIADAGMDNILTCDITTVTLDGNNSTGSNLAFEWQNAAGDILDNTSSIQVAETGVYTLIVTNTESGCTSEATTTVTPDANLPTPVAAPDGILNCIIGTVNIDASASTSVSGNTSFIWEDDSGNPIATQNNIDVSVPGMYTLIVTDDDNGCSATMQVQVNQDIIPPVADAGLSQTLICGQTDVTLSGSGSNGNNLTYEWQDDLGNSIGITPSVDVVSAGIYTLIVTNEDNGCSASSSVSVIADMNLPTAEAGIGETLTCTTTMVTLNGNGSSQGSNFEYEWQDQAGNVVSTDLMWEVSNPGIYTLIVLDTDNNCTTQDQVTIVQDINDPTAFADYGSAQSLDCNNTSISLDGSGSSPFGDLTFEWDTNDGNIASGGNTINPEINAPGTYTLTVTNQTNGCTDITQITVDQNVVPPVVLIDDPDLITCVVTAVTLDGTSSSSNGDYTYTWTGNGIVSGGNTLEPIVNQSGIFTLTIVDNDNGCENEGTITVNQNTTPPIANAAAEDEFDCLTTSVSLNGNGSSTGAGFSYNWTGNGIIDNSGSLNPTVYQAGIYTLIVTDASNGCTQTDNITVLEDTNVPTSAEVLIDPPLCFGESGNISVLSIDGGNTPYLYSLDGGENFSGQNLFTNLDPGNYDLVVQDANGCEYAESLFIPGEIELTVVVEPEVLIQLGDDYQINALVNIPEEEIDTIIWSPIEGLSCTDCLDPTVEIHDFSVYTVTVINQNGCVDTDQIILRVQKDRDVYIPNIFSPNNDGPNDIFMIFAGGNQIKEITSFQVFDRWGELVFEDHNFQPNNPAHGWDGKLRGEEVNSGVFVYWARVEFIDGEFLIFKGDVTLAR
jgi:large repetitive protein